MKRSTAKSATKITAIIASIFLAGNASSMAKQADVTAKMTADDIETLMTKAGLSPKVVQDKTTGAPVATGRAGSIRFVVRALECDGRPLACGRLLMFANFDLSREETTADLAAVNGFNEKSPDGRAYVIEATNQIGVDYIIDLTGGVTTDHIGSRLKRWPGVIGDFVTEIQNANKGS